MPKKLPAHLKIRRYLLQLISELQPNARLPTEMELAERFAVSRLTAHKAVMRLQQEGLVVRRRRGGTFVALQARRIQTNGTEGRHGSLVIACPNWFSADIWHKVDMAERLAVRHSLTPVNFRMNPDTDIEGIVKLCDSLDRPRGVIVIPPSGETDQVMLKKLHALSIPVVFLSGVGPVPASWSIHSVSQDYFATGKIETEYLLKRGHRRIGYIANEPSRPASQLCYDGMRAAYREQGVSLRELKRSHDEVTPWGDSAQAGYDLTRALIKRSPTAMVFDSHAGAMAGLYALYEQGFKIPEDVSVLVNAVSNQVDRFTWPRLGTVAVLSGQLVEAALTLVLEPPSEAQSLLVAPTITLRDSVTDIEPV